MASRGTGELLEYILAHKRTRLLYNCSKLTLNPASSAAEQRELRRGGNHLADINLTQGEANALIEMEKCRVDEKEYLFPPAGRRISIPLTSLDKRETFMLDVTRAQIKLTKATYQERARQAVILMRLDLEGPVHRNPDGEEILGPHLHIYREGYGDKWAIPAPTDRYSNTLDLFSTFEAFMQHCNITNPPTIQKGLFS